MYKCTNRTNRSEQRAKERRIKKEDKEKTMKRKGEKKVERKGEEAWREGRNNYGQVGQ